MKRSAEAAWERAMKVQEVILRAIAKQITWWQAAEIIGISDRQLRRWQRRYEEHGYTGLIDRRRGRVSERQVPLNTVEEVLRLYKEQYFDFNVRHFHEKLVADHNIKLSYTWVKRALQGAGLVKFLSLLHGVQGQQISGNTAELKLTGSGVVLRIKNRHEGRRPDELSQHRDEVRPASNVPKRRHDQFVAGVSAWSCWPVKTGSKLVARAAASVQRDLSFAKIRLDR